MEHRSASYAAAACPGLLLVFVVDDIDAQWERLRSRVYGGEAHTDGALVRTLLPGARSERHRD